MQYLFYVMIIGLTFPSIYEASAILKFNELPKYTKQIRFKRSDGQARNVKAGHNIECTQYGTKVTAYISNAYFLCTTNGNGFFYQYRECPNKQQTFYETLQGCSANMGGGSVFFVLPNKVCADDITDTYVMPYPNKNKPNFYMVCLPTSVHVCKCRDGEIFDTTMKFCTKIALTTKSIEVTTLSSKHTERVELPSKQDSKSNITSVTKEITITELNQRTDGSTATTARTTSLVKDSSNNTTRAEDTSSTITQNKIDEERKPLTSTQDDSKVSYNQGIELTTPKMRIETPTYAYPLGRNFSTPSELTSITMFTEPISNGPTATKEENKRTTLLDGFDTERAFPSTTKQEFTHPSQDTTVLNQIQDPHIFSTYIYSEGSPTPETSSNKIEGTTITVSEAKGPSTLADAEISTPPLEGASAKSELNGIFNLTTLKINSEMSTSTEPKRGTSNEVKATTSGFPDKQFERTPSTIYVEQDSTTEQSSAVPTQDTPFKTNKQERGASPTSAISELDSHNPTAPSSGQVMVTGMQSTQIHTEYTPNYLAVANDSVYNNQQDFTPLTTGITATLDIQITESPTTMESTQPDMMTTPTLSTATIKSTDLFTNEHDITDLTHQTWTIIQEREQGKASTLKEDLSSKSTTELDHGKNVVNGATTTYTAIQTTHISNTNLEQKSLTITEPSGTVTNTDSNLRTTTDHVATEILLTEASAIHHNHIDRETQSTVTNGYVPTSTELNSGTTSMRGSNKDSTQNEVQLSTLTPPENFYVDTIEHESKGAFTETQTETTSYNVDRERQSIFTTEGGVTFSKDNEGLTHMQESENHSTRDLVYLSTLTSPESIVVNNAENESRSRSTETQTETTIYSINQKRQPFFTTAHGIIPTDTMAVTHNIQESIQNSTRNEVELSTLTPPQHIFVKDEENGSMITFTKPQTETILNNINPDGQSIFPIKDVTTLMNDNFGPNHIQKSNSHSTWGNLELSTMTTPREIVVENKHQMSTSSFTETQTETILSNIDHERQTIFTTQAPITSIEVNADKNHTQKSKTHSTRHSVGLSTLNPLDHIFTGDQGNGTTAILNNIDRETHPVSTTTGATTSTEYTLGTNYIHSENHSTRDNEGLTKFTTPSQLFLVDDQEKDPSSAFTEATATILTYVTSTGESPGTNQMQSTTKGPNRDDVGLTASNTPSEHLLVIHEKKESTSMVLEKTEIITNNIDREKQATSTTEHIRTSTEDIQGTNQIKDTSMHSTRHEVRLTTLTTPPEYVFVDDQEKELSSTFKETQTETILNEFDRRQESNMHSTWGNSELSTMTTPQEIVAENEHKKSTSSFTETQTETILSNIDHESQTIFTTQAHITAIEVNTNTNHMQQSKNHSTRHSVGLSTLNPLDHTFTGDQGNGLTAVLNNIDRETHPVSTATGATTSTEYTLGTNYIQQSEKHSTRDNEGLTKFTTPSELLLVDDQEKDLSSAFTEAQTAPIYVTSTGDSPGTNQMQGTTKGSNRDEVGLTTSNTPSEHLLVIHEEKESTSIVIEKTETVTNNIDREKQATSTTEHTRTYTEDVIGSTQMQDTSKHSTRHEVGLTTLTAPSEYVLVDDQEKELSSTFTEKQTETILNDFDRGQESNRHSSRGISELSTMATPQEIFVENEHKKSTSSFTETQTETILSNIDNESQTIFTTQASTTSIEINTDTNHTQQSKKHSTQHNVELSTLNPLDHIFTGDQGNGLTLTGIQTAILNNIDRETHPISTTTGAKTSTEDTVGTNYIQKSEKHSTRDNEVLTKFTTPSELLLIDDQEKEPSSAFTETQTATILNNFEREGQFIFTTEDASTSTTPTENHQGTMQIQDTRNPSTQDNVGLATLNTPSEHLLVNHEEKESTSAVTQKSETISNNIDRERGAYFTPEYIRTSIGDSPGTNQMQGTTKHSTLHGVGLTTSNTPSEHILVNQQEKESTSTVTEKTGTITNNIDREKQATSTTEHIRTSTEDSLGASQIQDTSKHSTQHEVGLSTLTKPSEYFFVDDQVKELSSTFTETQTETTLNEFARRQQSKKHSTRHSVGLSTLNPLEHIFTSDQTNGLTLTETQAANLLNKIDRETHPISTTAGVTTPTEDTFGTNYIQKSEKHSTRDNKEWTKFATSSEYFFVDVQQKELPSTSTETQTETILNNVDRGQFIFTTDDAKTSITSIENNPSTIQIQETRKQSTHNIELTTLNALLEHLLVNHQEKESTTEPAKTISNNMDREKQATSTTEHIRISTEDSLSANQMQDTSKHSTRHEVGLSTLTTPSKYFFVDDQEKELSSTFTETQTKTTLNEFARGQQSKKHSTRHSVGLSTLNPLEHIFTSDQTNGLTLTETQAANLLNNIDRETHPISTTAGVTTPTEDTFGTNYIQKSEKHSTRDNKEWTKFATPSEYFFVDVQEKELPSTSTETQTETILNNVDRGQFIFTTDDAKTSITSIENNPSTTPIQETRKQSTHSIGLTTLNALSEHLLVNHQEKESTTETAETISNNMDREKQASSTTGDIIISTGDILGTNQIQDTTKHSTRDKVRFTTLTTPSEYLFVDDLEKEWLSTFTETQTDTILNNFDHGQFTFTTEDAATFTENNPSTIQIQQTRKQSTHDTVGLTTLSTLSDPFRDEVGSSTFTTTSGRILFNDQEASLSTFTEIETATILNIIDREMLDTFTTEPIGTSTGDILGTNQVQDTTKHSTRDEVEFTTLNTPSEHLLVNHEENESTSSVTENAETITNIIDRQTQAIFTSEDIRISTGDIPVTNQMQDTPKRSPLNEIGLGILSTPSGYHFVDDKENPSRSTFTETQTETILNNFGQEKQSTFISEDETNSTEDNLNTNKMQDTKMFSTGEKVGWTTLSTPVKHLFDDEQEKESTNTVKEKTDSTWTTFESITSIWEVENMDLDVCCIQAGVFRYKNSCKSYYACVPLGDAFISLGIHKCHGCLQFNSMKGVCDFPENVNECRSDDGTDRSCTSTGNFSIPLVEDCRKYYECSTSSSGIIKLVVQECPFGYIFNKKEQQCILGDHCLNVHAKTTLCTYENQTFPNNFNCSVYNVCTDKHNFHQLYCSNGYAFDGKSCKLKSEVLCDPNEACLDELMMLPSKKRAEKEIQLASHQDQ